MEYLTRARACEYLGFGRTKLDKLRSQEKLPFYRDGGTVLFSKDDLDAYRESCKVNQISSITVANVYGTYRNRRKTKVEGAIHI